MKDGIIIPLLLAGGLAGAVNFFINYIDLPFVKPKDQFTDEPNKIKWWIALIGYIIVGIAGSFLTPVIDALIGLKGLVNTSEEIDKYVLFGYGLIFGYSTTRLLVGILDSLIKRLTKAENSLTKIKEKILDIEEKKLIEEGNKLVLEKPKWKDVFDGYPKTADGQDDLPNVDVFTSILGSNYDREIFNNACATRVSLGLINSGIILPKNFIIQVGKFKGKGFIASALKLKITLSSPDFFSDADTIIKNPTNLEEVQKKIGNRNGIYIILGGFDNGISGHSTLWVGSKKDVIGGNNYVSNNREIYFWELM